MSDTQSEVSEPDEEPLPTPRQLFFMYGSSAAYAVAAVLFLVNGEIIGWIGVPLAIIQLVMGIRAQRRLKRGLATAPPTE